MFQKFSQADSSDTREKSGNGLGLAIGKELIERMNGLVGFRSVPGEGANFHFDAVATVALARVGGYELKVCASGRQALEEAEAFAPQLILLDVMMPGMDGPSTLTALRQRPALAAVPILFMTAKVQPAEIETFKALGALEVIAKPFDPMTLAATVQRIWDRHHG